MDLDSFIKTSTYQEQRQVFFKELPEILKKAVEKANYSTEQPFDVLLRQFSKEELFYYLWKEFYSKEYIFDKEDQREALPRTMLSAYTIVSNDTLRKAFILNHDNYLKKEYNKLSNNVANILVGETK